MCNYVWLLLLHATSAQSFDRLVQLCTQKYITRRQRGMHLHPPYPPRIRHCQGMGNAKISAMTQLEYVLKGVKKATPGRSRYWLPITPDILRRLKQVWQQDPIPRNVKMLRAGSCLCFFGFLRSREIVSPSENLLHQNSS